MPRNGSGVMTPDVDFTTEAASPPIEIAKLDQVLDDIADELTNSLAANGETNPTANIKMNGFRLINLGAATALTDAARVSELIDQDHIYYVDSGSANTYVITPSPAIAAYEEGQRFVFRAANGNSGASTLNVNGLGAIAIQTVNAAALVSGAIVAGGYYEVTYDANASPDRWVLTSMPSTIDGLLSGNVVLEDAANAFTNAGNTFAANSTTVELVPSNGIPLRSTVAGGDTNVIDFVQGGDDWRIGAGLVDQSDFGLINQTDARLSFRVTGAGDLVTPNLTASEFGYKGTPQNEQNGDYTLVLTDAGKTIYKASGGAGETITIPANGSVAFPVGTIVRVVNNGGGSLAIAITTDTLSLAGIGTTGSRTLADHGVAVLEKVASTEWFISGAGVS